MLISLLHVSVYDHHQGTCTETGKMIFMLKHWVKLCRYMLFGATSSNNFTQCFNIIITLVRFNTSSLMMVVDRNM